MNKKWDCRTIELKSKKIDEELMEKLLEELMEVLYIDCCQQEPIASTEPCSEQKRTGTDG